MRTGSSRTRPASRSRWCRIRDDIDTRVQQPLGELVRRCLTRRGDAWLRPLRVGFVFVGDPDRRSQHDHIGHRDLDQDPGDRVPVPGPGHLHPLPRDRRHLGEGAPAHPPTGGRRRNRQHHQDPRRQRSSSPCTGLCHSPTIRINGVDIAGELVESASRDSCSESCACNGGVDCRDWVWQGQRSQEPPLGLVVEAIMRHAGDTDPGSTTPSPPGSGGVPAILRRYSRPRRSTPPGR